MASVVLEIVGEARAALETVIANGTDCTVPIQQLVTLDTSLQTKFVRLDFCELLAHNGQSGDALKRLIMALNILEKYGRHLLKQTDARSNMWRHIKYSNNIFRDRVDTIKGGRKIMQQLGYTLMKADGVAFPDGVEPDHDHVLQVVADILLGKKELEAYLGGVHPHPGYIEGFLHPELVEVLSQSSMASTPQPRTADRALSDRRPQSHRPPSGRPQSEHPPADKDSEAVMSSQTAGIPRSSLQTKDLMPNASASREPADNGEPVSSTLMCDICGAYAADAVCEMCDKKQLCNGCDIKWHSHPKRQNHKTCQIPGRAVPGQLPPPNPCGGKALAIGSNSGLAVAAGGRVSAQSAPTVHYNRESMHQRYMPPQPQYGPADTMFYTSGTVNPALPLATEVTGNHGGHDWSANYPGRGHQPANSHMTSHLPAQPSYSMVPHYRVPVDTHISMHPILAHLPPYVPPSFQYQHHDPDTGKYVYGRMMSSSGSSGAVLPSPNTVSSTEYSDQFFRPATSNTDHDRSFQWTSGSMKPDTAQRSESKLLPRIKSIEDLQKRKARLDVSLMTLQNDMVDWDKQINAVILQNPNFFEDKTYKDLNQKKRNHLQEIQELEAYSCQLENNENLERRADGSTHEAASGHRQPHARIPAGETDSSVGYQSYAPNVPLYPGGPVLPPSSMGPGMAYVAASPGQGMSVTQGGPPPADTSSRLATGTPNRPVYYHPVNQSTEPANQNTSFSGLTNEDEMNSRMADVRRMLVLDPSSCQTPKTASDKQEMRLNIPVNDLGRDQPNMTITSPSDMVVYPPSLSDITTPPVVADLSASQPNIPPPAATIQTQASNKLSNVAAPPANMPNMATSKHVQSTPNLVAYAKEPVTLRKPKSSADVHWACEHCTYQNEMDSRVCAVCSKTSDNAQILYGVTADAVSEVDEEPCQFCTYKNPPGMKVCVVCNKTRVASAAGRNVSQEPASGAPGVNTQITSAAGHEVSPLPVSGPPGVSTQIPSSAGRDVSPRRGAPGVEMQVTSAVGGEESTGLGSAPLDLSTLLAEGGRSGIGVGLEKLINKEQDQVLLEKKRAWAEFERRNRASAAGAGGDGADRLPLEGPGSGPGTEAQKPGAKSPTPKSFQRLKQPSDHRPSSESSDSYNSAHSSFSHAPENVEGAKPGLAGADSGGVPVLEAEATHGDKKVGMAPNFAEAIEHINLQRAQEQMSVDGRDYISLIKNAEKAGFSMAEVEIAVDQNIDHRGHPLDWLTNTWQQLVDIVVVKAAEVGRVAYKKDVGKMSSAEAKAALIESKGNVDDATVRCVSQRQDTFADLSGQGVYKQEDILTALHQHGGARGPALDQLNQGLLVEYMERLWLLGDVAIPDPMMVEMNQSVANSVVEDDDFQQVVYDFHVDLERRIRMIFVEGKLCSWGRAETVISILDSHVTKATGAGGDPPLQCSLEDIIEAVRNCGDRKSSLVYLQQECGICYVLYPMTKIRSLGCCNCKLCAACVKQNFEVVVRERHVRNWGCPLCESPDLEDDDAATQYFELLQLILQSLVDEEIMNLFDTKLRDWHLQKDPNFRWCAHCAAGFLWERPDILGMTCQTCRQKTCFLCKIKWEDQHEGHSCEQFQQWKFENDADTQAAGLARHLQENGIDCPRCKMRYALAKGGCMHFTCPQCGHDFCSGCSQNFFKPGVCKLRKSCEGKGLHCHHPRDCFYYLRDNSYADLQKLLQSDGIEYNTKPTALQADKSHCPVMEQKEHGTAMRDELCGLDTGRGTAGLCELHYKEYLVGLLNRNKIDPVVIMGLKDMNILLQRCDLAIPKLQPTENELQYKKRLMQFIQEKIPLTR